MILAWGGALRSLLVREYLRRWRARRMEWLQSEMVVFSVLVEAKRRQDKCQATGSRTIQATLGGRLGASASLTPTYSPPRPRSSLAGDQNPGPPSRQVRYQHAEPSLATPLDALTQQPRSLTHETLQCYSSDLHCALVLGYNRVSPESCKPQARPWFVRACRYKVNCCFFAPRMTIVGIPSFRSRVAPPTPCLLP
jgi:hypothetical protein